ncbi:WSC domain-containing protein [Triangularia setosa]|uniref:WSC domain-containing protein n=1 Tax=Triangularia setosa TaxID=2587417 RepID=A0AAN6W932_9PEZI|nr:WSC domain-containing protein [Podospora setosa]
MDSFRLNMRLLSLGALVLSTASALPSGKLYSRQVEEDALTYAPLGCFVDSPGRVLPSKLISTHDMTAAKCAANCAGYDFFGTQWSSECYCGSVEPTDVAPASECNMPCSGNSDEICGAGMRLNVYEFDSSCDTEDPPTDISGYEYKGCYTDNVPQRVLGGITVTQPDMTLEKCAATCTAGGYPFFGVEYGAECFCGTTLDATSSKLAEGECSMTCAGDHSQQCGGPNRLNIYEKPNPVGTGSNLESVGGFQYTSCWTDKVDDRSLKAVDWRTDDMTIEKCAERCSEYLYFGLEYSRECYCGNELVGQSAPEKDCAMLCVGAPGQWCGGPDRLNLYSKTASTTTTSVATSTEVTTPIETETEMSATTAPEPEMTTSTEIETEMSTTITLEPDTTTSIETETETPTTTALEPGTTTVTTEQETTTSDTPAGTISTESSTTTTQGPDLTTITSCPPAPTYNGKPELCYESGNLPTVCKQLASSTLNSRSVGPSMSACKTALGRFGMTPLPAATACFPTTAMPANPASSVARSVADSVYACLNAPTASVLCQSDSECVTNTYTVGQVPAPTPTTGVDLLKGDGTFEDGTVGDWVVSGSTNIVISSVSNARPRSGSLGMHMRYLNTNGGSSRFTTTTPVIPGKQYRYNLFCLHTNPAALVSLYVYVYPNSLSNSFDDAAVYQKPANVWFTRTITFTATSSWVQLAFDVGGNRLNNGDGVDDVYIDDVTLVRLT